jgi:hypothetical protein
MSMTLSDMQRSLVKEAYAAFFRDPTSAQRQRAKEVLLDPEAPATAVFISARHLLGPTFISYEPDTLWQELELADANRDKLMAAIALAMTPSFYWDYRVFGATVHALSNDPVRPEEVPHCDAGPMAWAAFEAELLFALSDGESTRPEFDEPVEAYIAVALFDEGFVLPPSGLQFAAAELKAKLPKDSALLLGETEKAWADLPKEKLEQKKFEATPLGAQLDKLATSWIYVAEKTKRLRSELEKL